MEYGDEIGGIKNNPFLLNQENKNVRSKATMIVTGDGIQKHGRLPPIHILKPKLTVPSLGNYII